MRERRKMDGAQAQRGGRGVVVLAPCCGGKTTLTELLRAQSAIPVVESDEAVMEASGGSWPASAAENRRLVDETGNAAVSLPQVIYLTSFMAIELLEQARASKLSVGLLDVPLDELHRRNSRRVEVGIHGDMSHWFDEQLAFYRSLSARGLIDVRIDGTQPPEAVAGCILDIAPGRAT